jgi:hypothetical protein
MLLGVEFGLTGDAQAYTRHREAPCFGNRCFTFSAMRQALAFGQAGARLSHCVFDACVDLVLYRAIACPAVCHDYLAASLVCIIAHEYDDTANVYEVHASRRADCGKNGQNDENPRKKPSLLPLILLA